MAESPEIPPRFWRRIVQFLKSVRAGEWPAGGQVILNVSPEGKVTSVEAKGRDDGR